MACITCGHTMKGLVTEVHRRLFWCPRCGTLKAEVSTGPHSSWTETDVPTLIERARDGVIDPADSATDDNYWVNVRKLCETVKR